MSMTPPKKTGKPRTGKNRPRGYHISIQCQKAEYDTITEIAEKLGISREQVVRNVIMKHLHNEKNKLLSTKANQPAQPSPPDQPV